MTRFTTHITLLFLLSRISSAAAVEIKGTVLDPSGAAIGGAQVAIMNRLGIVAQTISDRAGAFQFKTADAANLKLVVTAAGFETKTLPVDASAPPIEVRLSLSPQVDSIQVAGSAIDVPLSEQGGSASVIPRQEIRERNEAQGLELMRYLPGLYVSQTGDRGGAASLFIRGGNANFNLVQIDGVPVNSFGLGIGFDFAHVPTDFLDRIEVVRGPQSAVYGSYANSGVVNFVTRSAEDTPPLDLLLEGGSHNERRFALGSGWKIRGFGLTAFASRMDTDGPVVNSDYRNENLDLHLTRNFGRQNFAVHGNFNSNESGVPGPYGSDPLHQFTGIDRLSRNKNNFADYGFHYQADLSQRVRQELFGGFFLNNNYFKSDFSSFNKDIRGQAETRTVVSVTSQYTMAAGFVFSREEAKNTFISGDSFTPFLLRRDQEGIYWENRFQLGQRLFLNAGARAEIFQTPHIPGNATFGRPEFRAQTLTRVNPKIAVAYLVSFTRLHASFGTGIRPPAGLEIAFTNNPALKPERTTGFDVGIDRRFLRDRVSLEGTYFYSRFWDLIVSLGGPLAKLSSYRSDNLSNSRAQGVELGATLRPLRTVSLSGNYTWLQSKILALRGSGNLAPAFFRVGQELLRRPRHSGAITSTFSYRNLSANVIGYFRGSTLDVEPHNGAFGGLFRNSGYANVGINVNYRAGYGVTLYGNLRNAFNQYYEEVFGFPSPRLNFVAGLKWSLARGKQ